MLFIILLILVVKKKSKILILFIKNLLPDTLTDELLLTADEATDVVLEALGDLAFNTLFDATGTDAFYNFINFSC